MDWMLTFSLDLDAPDIHGNSPLMYACARQRVGMILRLLRQGADVHHRNEEGFTALHWVCDREWADGVDLLLRAGADPTCTNHEGLLPVQCLLSSDGLSADEQADLGISSLNQARIRSLLSASSFGCGLK
jgi:ankyrin repeat protein